MAAGKSDNMQEHKECKEIYKNSVCIDINGESNLLHRRKNGCREKHGGITHLLSEEPFHIDDMAILEVLQPIYISMACFGMHWTGKKNWFRNVRCDRFTIHCIFTLLVSWTLTIGCFFCYEKHDKFGNGLFRKLYLHFYCIHVTLALTIHVYSKHKHIPGLLKLWENYKLKHGGTRISKMKSYVKNLVILINVSFVSIYIVLLYPMFTTNALHQYLSAILTLQKYVAVESSLWFILPMYLVMTYVTLANIQTILFTLSINHLLDEEFQEVTSKLSDVIARNVTSTKDERLENEKELKFNEIEQYRQRHFDLCQIVTSYDTATTNFHAVLYTVSIPTIILLIFSVLGIGHKSCCYICG